MASRAWRCAPHGAGSPATPGAMPSWPRSAERYDKMPIVGIAERFEAGVTRCYICRRLLEEKFLVVIPDIHAGNSVCLHFCHENCSPVAIRETATHRANNPPNCAS